MDGFSRTPNYLCTSPRITSLLRSGNGFPDPLLVTHPSLTIPVSDGFSNPLALKYHSLGKLKRLNPHNSPRPPHAPAASFKSLYRKCSGPHFAHNPTCCCRSTSDTVLRTSGELGRLYCVAKPTRHHENPCRAPTSRSIPARGSERTTAGLPFRSSNCDWRSPQSAWPRLPTGSSGDVCRSGRGT